jgi:hypothetical protein
MVNLEKIKLQRRNSKCRLLGVRLSFVWGGIKKKIMKRLAYSVLAAILAAGLLNVIGLSAQDAEWWILCIVINGLIQYIYSAKANEA